MVYEFLKKGIKSGIDYLEEMLKHRNDLLRKLNPHTIEML
jgi:hypothetical protein